MLTYRVGHGGAAGAKAMGAYLVMETLTPEHGSAAAYYLGEIPTRSWSLEEQFGRLINAGELGYAEALDMLVTAELTIRGTTNDVPALEERIGDQLVAAATRADFEDSYGPSPATVGTLARIRHDLAPDVARALRLDATQPLSQEALSHLLSGRRADGEDIEGRTKRSGGLSIAEVFGLPTKGRGCVPPSGQALENVLAGKRADGTNPQHDGKALSAAVVAGARKRFLDIFEASKTRDLTAEEKANIGAGKMARGLKLTAHRWQSKVNARNERVTFIDFTMSVDKSVSVAWALAPTEAERGIIHNAHRDAVASTMAYIEQKLGHARRGDGGRNGTEAGRIAWLSFDHYTSRPTVDYERIDKEGKPYTDFATVPLKAADMQLHTHTIVPNVVVTDSGHIGSIDLDKLQGITKQFGAVFQAYLAQNLRRHGVDMVRDERTGAARITAVPDRIVKHFSKRTHEAEQTAKEYAKARGLDWDDLSGDQKSAMMKAGADELRQAKDKRLNSEEPSDFARWQEQAREFGYSHRSVLRPDAVKPALEREQRIELAYGDTQKALAKAFAHKATISLEMAHEIAARSLIDTGIEDPARDIADVMRATSERGIIQDDEQTQVVFAREDAVRGKVRWSVTSGLVERQELELIGHAQAAAQDHTADLTPAAIQTAVDRFLHRRPDVDRAGEQWRAQREMMDRLAMGGRLSVGIGVAGAGKSTVLGALVDAWREEGREVFGGTLAWRQTYTLKSAGIDQSHMAAMEPFLRRAAQGKYALNDRSVVVVDELGLIGTRQLLELTRLQQRHGFQLVMMGDPKQCASVEAGPVISLMEKALGKEAIPEIVTSIRQKSARELATTAMWREGRAAEALERKMDDGDLKIVAGSRRVVVEAAVGHWHERTHALEKGETLLVIAPTNEDAHEIGTAIRATRRAAGDLGQDIVTVSVRDPNGGAERALPLAVGDHVRLFTRVHDAGNWKTVLGNNGDVVEIRGADRDGLTVRNIVTAAEGKATWKRLTPFAQDKPALAYGYVSTVHTSQSQTVVESIFVLPGGSRQADARSAYVALSRHERRVSLVISEGAERRQIFSRKAIGSFDPIDARDVIRNIASNLSRQPVKTSALELLSQSSQIYRGTIRHLGAGLEPRERAREAGNAVQRRYQLLRLEMSRGMERIADIVRAVHDRLAHGHERSLGRGRGLGL